MTLLRGRPARGWRKEILVEHHGRVQDPGDPDLPSQGSGGGTEMGDQTLHRCAVDLGDRIACG